MQITNILDKINRCVKAAEVNEISPEKATETLVELTEQLENMKRKVCVCVWIWVLVAVMAFFLNTSTVQLKKYWQEESVHARRLKNRVVHLNTISGITSVKAPEFQQWSKTRLNRLVVDYLLREGLTETAKLVATENDVEVNVNKDISKGVCVCVYSIRVIRIWWMFRSLHNQKRSRKH